jgi:hypothetical protein
MSKRRFLVFVGTVFICALMFSAPGLYQLYKQYRSDRVRELANLPKDNSWSAISRTEQYQRLPEDARAKLKEQFFQKRILPNLQSDEKLSSKEAIQFAFEFFMQQPDDNGQSYFSSMLGSAGRGLVAIFPWCCDAAASALPVSETEAFASDVRASIERIAPVNPIHAEKWPTKLTFWLGFAAPPAAFFAIRAKRRKRITTGTLAPVHPASAGGGQD